MSIFDNTPQEQVTALYVSYFNRAPDPVGLGYWVGRLNDGMSLGAIADSFSVQPEATTKYPYLSNPNVASAEAFLNTVYMNLFNRMIDDEGKAYWLDQLEAGRSVGEIILDIAGGAQGDDAVIIENKVAVGVDFAQQAANVPGFQYDNAAQDAASAVLDGVDATDASVVEGKAETAEFVGGANNPGTTTVLTSGVDALQGTAANDVFIGTVDGNPFTGNTLATGDSINGGAGLDTLRITAVNSGFGGGNFVAPALSSVERIEVRALDSLELDLSASTGVETVAITGGEGSVNLYGVKAIVDLEITGDSDGIYVEYDAAAVAGTADVQNLLLTSANTTVQAFGTETLAVTATGENSLHTHSDFETITVAGAGDLEFQDTLDGTTLDASASTGDITAFFSGADAAVTGGAGNDEFTFDVGGNVVLNGGAGNDVFNFSGGFDVGDTVTGGEGTDKIVVEGGNFTLAAGAFNNLASVERVEFTGAGTTLNGVTFNNASITNLLFNTAGDDVINNAGSARTYEFGDDNNGAAEFRMNAASTTLNVDLTGNTNVGDVLVELAGTQPTTAVSTINLTSAGTDSNSVGDIDARAGSSLVIDGSADLSIDGLENGTTVNASAFTGDLTITGSADADTFALGSGSDLIRFAAGDSDATDIDVVTGFTVGVDGDILAAGGGVYTALDADTQIDISLLAGAELNLANAADSAANGDVAVGWTAFSFQGQTYALYSADDVYAAADDVLVQLTGVTVASLTADNFGAIA